MARDRTRMFQVCPYCSLAGGPQPPWWLRRHIAKTHPGKPLSFPYTGHDELFAMIRSQVHPSKLPVRRHKSRQA